MEELKNCPVCESEPIMRHNIEDKFTTKWILYCPYCINIESVSSTEKHAIYLWNNIIYHIWKERNIYRKKFEVFLDGLGYEDPIGFMEKNSVNVIKSEGEYILSLAKKILQNRRKRKWDLKIE